jgi:hypothetical protein
MVLKNCGPRGYPGMAEVGNMPLPAKLLRKGVSDMVRISDARMSGTAYGTVVLHASPEAAAGGPLALVRSGDIVNLDVTRRLVDVEVDEATSRCPPRTVDAPDVAGAWFAQALCKARAAGAPGGGSGFSCRAKWRVGGPRLALAQRLTLRRTIPASLYQVHRVQRRVARWVRFHRPLHKL